MKINNEMHRLPCVVCDRKACGSLDHQASSRPPFSSREPYSHNQAMKTLLNNSHRLLCISLLLAPCLETPAQPELVYYVNQANSNPVFPYTNWETAAANIQDAIGAGSVPGRLVLVTNGVYRTGGVAVEGTVTNRVALTNAVLVQSVNGPAVTVIDGAGAVRCACRGHAGSREPKPPQTCGSRHRAGMTAPAPQRCGSPGSEAQMGQ